VVATIFAERAGEESIAYGIPSPIVEEVVAEAEEQISPAADVRPGSASARSRLGGRPPRDATAALATRRVDDPEHGLKYYKGG
jgi:hypothetical protein